VPACPVPSPFLFPPRTSSGGRIGVTLTLLSFQEFQQVLFSQDRAVVRPPPLPFFPPRSSSATVVVQMRYTSPLLLPFFSPSAYASKAAFPPPSLSSQHLVYSTSDPFFSPFLPLLYGPAGTDGETVSLFSFSFFLPLGRQPRRPAPQLPHLSFLFLSSVAADGNTDGAEGFFGPFSLFSFFSARLLDAADRIARSTFFFSPFPPFPFTSTAPAPSDRAESLGVPFPFFPLLVT